MFRQYIYRRITVLVLGLGWKSMPIIRREVLNLQIIRVSSRIESLCMVATSCFRMLDPSTVTPNCVNQSSHQQFFFGVS